MKTSIRSSSLLVVASLILAGAVHAQSDGAHETKTSFTDDNWRAELALAAELARRSHPAAEERLRRLEGLAPERYLAMRRPEPEVARELTRLVRSGEVPPALVAALVVAGDEGYPFSAPGRFGKTPAPEVERLMRMERAQLLAGLLLALGDSGHPSAFFVLRGVLTDPARSDEARRVAAIALGKTGDERALAVLSALALDEKAATDRRAAAIAGLSHQRTSASVALLADLSRRLADPALQRATALALGGAASPSALYGRAPSAALPMREAAAAALVDLLERSDDPKVAAAAIDGLAIVAHEGALAPLSALASDETRAAPLRQRAADAQRRLERSLRRAGR